MTSIFSKIFIDNPVNSCYPLLLNFIIGIYIIVLFSQNLSKEMGKALKLAYTSSSFIGLIGVTGQPSFVDQKLSKISKKIHTAMKKLVNTPSS